LGFNVYFAGRETPRPQGHGDILHDSHFPENFDIRMFRELPREFPEKFFKKNMGPWVKQT
jgi:hypothetical protein